MGRFTRGIIEAAERSTMAYELPQGPESVYAFLNQGNLDEANLLLRDIWPVTRYEPVKLAWPLTWKENPYGERYWRFNFYALRPTVNLLWAYYATGDARYKDKLVAILKSYLAYDAERASTRSAETSTIRTVPHFGR